MIALLSSFRRAGPRRLLTLSLAALLGLAALLSLPSPARAAARGEEAAVERGKAVSRSYHFDAAQKEMSYALYVPTGYDSARPSPLVVLLHGLGSNPMNVLQYRGIIPEAERRGYLVVAPYGYNERGGYGAWGQRRVSLGALGGSEEGPENLGELSEKDVLNVLGIVRQEFRIDPKRIYLMGHSMGGGGTLHLGIEHPELWAALAPLAPAIYSNPEELSKIRKMPIIVVQGEMDRLVHVENTRRWVEVMKKLQMDYRYLELPGGDHLFSIISNPKMIAEVFDFFDHHPAPEHPAARAAERP